MVKQKCSSLKARNSIGPFLYHFFVLNSLNQVDAESHRVHYAKSKYRLSGCQIHQLPALVVFPMPLAAMLLHSVTYLTRTSIRCRIAFFFRSRDLQILGLVDAKSGKASMNWTSFINGAIEANYHANTYN